MMGVVFVPFPTALLGENLLTSHASPAVVLYSAMGALMAVGWALVSWAASHITLYHDAQHRSSLELPIQAH